MTKNQQNKKKRVFTLFDKPKPRKKSFIGRLFQ